MNHKLTMSGALRPVFVGTFCLILQNVKGCDCWKVSLLCEDSPKYNSKPETATRTSGKPNKLIIVKYGGSAITHKDRFETLNEQKLRATAEQLSGVLKENPRLQCIVVHGAGALHMYICGCTLFNAFACATLNVTLINLTCFDFSHCRLVRSLPSKRIQPKTWWSCLHHSTFIIAPFIII